MFAKPSREKYRIKIAIAGVSNVGKTLSSLLIATGLGSRIAFIDAEQRATEYHGRPIAASSKTKIDFDICEIQEPYHPAKFTHAIRVAENEGYDVIIIDNLSFPWAGKGGMLDLHAEIETAERKERKSVDPYSLWQKINPHHEALFDTIRRSRSHIIATLRMKEKSEYVPKADGSGKKELKSLGLQVIQRDDYLYSFSVVLSLDATHHADSGIRDNTGIFQQRFIPSVQTGRLLRDWLGQGGDPTTSLDQSPPPDPAQARLAQIITRLTAVQMEGYLNAYLTRLCKTFRVQDIEQIPAKEFNARLQALQLAELDASLKHKIRDELARWQMQSQDLAKSA